MAFRDRHGIKRQRTTSGSSSSPSNIKKSQEGVESEDDAGLAGNQNDGAKKIRGAAARNHREKELRDREKEREKERADAAGRRKGRAERAERRRGDGKSRTFCIIFIGILTTPRRLGSF